MSTMPTTSTMTTKKTMIFRLIHFTIWTNKFGNLDKYILQFGQIHFAIWTKVKVGEGGQSRQHLTLQMNTNQMNTMGDL